jgi:hypothetical protein
VSCMSLLINAQQDQIFIPKKKMKTNKLAGPCEHSLIFPAQYSIEIPNKYSVDIVLNLVITVAVSRRQGSPASRSWSKAI